LRRPLDFSIPMASLFSSIRRTPPSGARRPSIPRLTLTLRRGGHAPGWTSAPWRDHHQQWMTEGVGGSSLSTTLDCHRVPASLDPAPTHRAPPGGSAGGGVRADTPHILR
jgi:hypothetical protein